MTGLIYNFNSLPQWGDSGISTSNFTTSDQGIIQQGANGEQLAPYSQDYQKGYDSVAGRLNPSKRTQALTHANANLCDGSYYFPLFIYNSEINYALAGVSAQSQMTQDFYPQNITIPGFTLYGQCYDQTSYGMMTEFIHMAQHRAVGYSSTTKPVMQLYIRGNAYNVNGNSGSSKGITVNGELSPNQSIKGQQSEILCLGYINSQDRTHETGVYAPTYSIDFIVSNMLQGPYTDSVATQGSQTSWISFITGTDATELGTKSQLQQNNKYLKKATALNNNFTKGEA